MADNSDTLTAHFKYVGPGQAPDHVSFLLNTSVNASAGAYYNLSGLTSGLTATATLGDDTVTASLPDTPTANKSGRRLIRVAATGGIATISLPASVSGQTDNDTVVDGIVSGDGYHYFFMNQSAVTTASAGASATANAQYDEREVMLSAMGHEVTYHKGVKKNSDGTDFIDPTTGSTVPAPEANKPSNNSLRVDIGLPLKDFGEDPVLYSISYKPTVTYGADFYCGGVLQFLGQSDIGDTFTINEQLKDVSDSGTMPLPASDAIRSSDPLATTWDIPPLKVQYQQPYIYFSKLPGLLEEDYDHDHPHLEVADAKADSVNFNYTFIKDGAVADYNLDVDLHLPYEKWHLNSQEQNDATPFEDVESDPASQKAQFSVKVKYASIDNLMSAGGELADVGLTVISDLAIENPYAALIVVMTGAAVKSAAPEPATSNMDDKLEDWTAAVSKTQDALKPGGKPEDALISGTDLSNYDSMTDDQKRALWAQCTWTLVQRVPIKTFHWEAEHYKGLGYVDQIPSTITQALPPVYYHKYVLQTQAPTQPITP